MSESRKYFYMKVKEDFFDTPEMIALESLEDGMYFSNILMKLYAKSVRTEGKLMIRDKIPYTPKMLAQIVRHQTTIVEKALKAFEELGLIEVLTNGAIYMCDIQNFIGQSSSEADRIRKYRAKIASEKSLLLGGEIGQCPTKMGQCPTNVQRMSNRVEKQGVQMYDKCTPKIEIEIEKEIEKENKQRKAKTKHRHGDHVLLTDEEYQKLVTAFGKRRAENYIDEVNLYIEASGKTYKSHYAAVITFYRNECKRMKKEYVKVEDLLARAKTHLVGEDAETRVNKINKAWEEVLSRRNNITPEGWSDPLIYASAKCIHLDEDTDEYCEYLFKKWYRDDLENKNKE